MGGAIGDPNPGALPTLPSPAAMAGHRAGTVVKGPWSTPYGRWLGVAGIAVLGVAWLGLAWWSGVGPAGEDGPNGADRPVVVGPPAPSQSTPGDADWTLTGPAFGEVRRSATFRVALRDDVHPPKAVRFTGSASNGDGSFSPTAVELSDSKRSAEMTYTPTLWGKRTIAVHQDGGLRDPGTMLEFVAKVQLGASGTARSGNRGPDLGGFDFFARGAWWQELGRKVVDDPVAPDSDSLLAGFGAGKLRVDWDTTTDHGGNSKYGIPYNVVPGDQPTLPLTIGDYAKESDPGPVPFFRGMTIENWGNTNASLPDPTKLKGTGDHHALVARRNEATGGLDWLYEYFQVGSDDQGRTWKCVVGGAQFDLTTGAPRRAGWTSADAAGLPMLPLLVRYDEAARGEIRHPFRVCISPGLSRNRFVWPARHAVYSGRVADGLPMGARLRLKRSWYEQNRNSFGPISRVLIDTMRNYGVIVADLANGGFWLNGVNDERWDHAELMKLRTMPVSAFEVVDTIKAPFRLIGPQYGQALTRYSFGLEHVTRGNSEFSVDVYFYQSTDGGKSWSSKGWRPQWIRCDDNHGGPFDVTFTPAVAGTYILRVRYGGVEMVEPPDMTMRVESGRATGGPLDRGPG